MMRKILTLRGASIFLIQFNNFIKLNAKRDQKQKHAQRLQLRKQEALPILNELGQWLKDQLVNGDKLPQSRIGKAIAYTLERGGVMRTRKQWPIGNG